MADPRSANNSPKIPQYDLGEFLGHFPRLTLPAVLLSLHWNQSRKDLLWLLQQWKPLRCWLLSKCALDMHTMLMQFEAGTRRTSHLYMPGPCRTLQNRGEVALGLSLPIQLKLEHWKLLRCLLSS